MYVLSTDNCKECRSCLLTFINSVKIESERHSESRFFQEEREWKVRLGSIDDGRRQKKDSSLSSLLFERL